MQSGFQRSGNVHPSVANKSGSSTPQAAFGGISGAATSPNVNLDFDEAEARSRAREILQDFVKQKNKSGELETQLQRCLMENERLTHQMRELRTEGGLQQERARREVDSLRNENRELEGRLETAQDEVRKVAQSFAQRASDTASHLRLKEQESQHLESELLRARDEIRSLRSEIIKLQGSGQSSEEIEKSQKRVVELARRLLDAEKAKATLEKSIVDDRVHFQQALRTIESLRKQCVESEERNRTLEEQRKGDSDRHDAAVKALHREMDMQRELYRTFVEQIGSGGVASHESRSAASPTQAAFKSPDTLEAKLAVSASQLNAANQTITTLRKQHLERIQEVDQVRAQLFAEKTKHVEVLAEAKYEANKAKHELDLERQLAGEKAQERQRDKEAYMQLQSVHQELKKDFAALHLDVGKGLAQLDDAQQLQQSLMRRVSDLQEEVRARDATTERLTEALAAREVTEDKVAELQARHSREVDMLRLQLQAGGGGTSRFASIPFGGDLLTKENEIRDLKHRLTLFETERIQWNAERAQLTRDFEVARNSAQQELNNLGRALEQAQIASAQYRTQATQALRESDEWRSAFHVSERTRSTLQAKIDELRDAVYAGQKDFMELEGRTKLYRQHVERLEAHGDRDSRDLYRTRRECATLEVALARAELELKNAEVQRVESIRPMDSSEQLLREKELIALRAERDRRSMAVRDKEAALAEISQQQQDYTAAGESSAQRLLRFEMSSQSPTRSSTQPLRPSDEQQQQGGGEKEAEE